MSKKNIDLKQDELRAFMMFVQEISNDPATRKSVAAGARNDLYAGIPDELATSLKAMSEDELRFLSRLKSHLDCVSFYDELDNPRLYYF